MSNRYIILLYGTAVLYVVKDNIILGLKKTEINRPLALSLFIFSNVLMVVSKYIFRAISDINIRHT